MFPRYVPNVPYIWQKTCYSQLAKVWALLKILWFYPMQHQKKCTQRVTAKKPNNEDDACYKVSNKNV